jgi:hypothetical protein
LDAAFFASAGDGVAVAKHWQSQWHPSLIPAVAEHLERFHLCEKSPRFCRKRPLCRSASVRERLPSVRNAAEGVPYRSSLPNLNVKVHQKNGFNNEIAPGLALSVWNDAAGGPGRFSVAVFRALRDASRRAADSCGSL